MDCATGDSKQNESALFYDKIANQDFHVHTFLSPCAKDPLWNLPAIARLADELGMHTVAVTDHFYQKRPGFSPPPFYEGVDERCYIQNLAEKASLETDVRILVSCEIDMIDSGVFTLEKNFAHSLPAGLVSSSHYHIGGIAQPVSADARAIGKYVLERMRGVFEWPASQILAHPLCALQNSLGDFRRVLDAITDEEFREVLALAAENNVAVEIRAAVFGEEKHLHDHHMRFYSLAKLEGCKIAPASDAHSADGFGNTGGIVRWAEKLGFSSFDVIDIEWLKNSRL